MVNYRGIFLYAVPFFMQTLLEYLITTQ